MQPSLGQRNPGLLGSAASTRSNATAGLGSFRACRWILSPSFVLVPVRVGGLFLPFLFFMCVLLRQKGKGIKFDSYSKQHSPSEALFRPSTGRISGPLEF